MRINFKRFFNQKKIQYVEREVRKHLPELFAQSISLENSNEILKIYEDISKFNNPQIMELFIKYSNLKYEENLYQNWLAYYIGFQKGMNSKSELD